MGPPGKGILKTQIPSFPKPVSEIQLPLAPHDCWDKDLGLLCTENSLVTLDLLQGVVSLSQPGPYRIPM